MTKPTVAMKRPIILSISTIPDVIYICTEKAFCYAEIICDILLDRWVTGLDADEEEGREEKYKEVQGFHYVFLRFINVQSKIQFIYWKELLNYLIIIAIDLNPYIVFFPQSNTIRYLLPFNFKIFICLFCLY